MPKTITDTEAAIVSEHWSPLALRCLTDFIASTLPDEVTVEPSGSVILRYSQRPFGDLNLTLAFSPSTDRVIANVPGTIIQDKPCDPDQAERLVSDFFRGRALEDIRLTYADTSLDSFRFVSDSSAEMRSV